MDDYKMLFRYFAIYTMASRLLQEDVISLYEFYQILTRFATKYLSDGDFRLKDGTSKTDHTTRSLG